jgi:hypothetical protein
MTKRADEGVPALKNDDVTGMTEDRQEEVIERSGRAGREEAAEEFFEEQAEQARETPSPRRDRER